MFVCMYCKYVCGCRARAEKGRVEPSRVSCITPFGLGRRQGSEGARQLQAHSQAPTQAARLADKPRRGPGGCGSQGLSRASRSATRPLGQPYAAPLVLQVHATHHTRNATPTQPPASYALSRRLFPSLHAASRTDPPRRAQCRRYPWARPSPAPPRHVKG